jgi:hypothetical protein
LMEWLNMHFIEPSTEEGDHLSSLERPWEDETFWPYLTRSVKTLLSWTSNGEKLPPDRLCEDSRKLRSFSWEFCHDILQKIYKN